MNPRTAVLGPFESHVRFANRGFRRMKYRPRPRCNRGRRCVANRYQVALGYATPPQGSTIASAAGIVEHFNLGWASSSSSMIIAYYKGLCHGEVCYAWQLC